VQLAMGVDTVNSQTFYLQARQSANVSWPMSLNPLGGNVGIGTTSPNTLLNVHGANPFVRINNTSADDHGIKISYGNSDAHGLHLLYNANSAVSFIDNTYQVVAAQVYGDIRFRQNVAGTMTTRMIIKADGGLVGIGTTSPGATLNVRYDNAGASTVALFENQRSVGGSADAGQIVVGARGYNNTVLRQNSDLGTNTIGGPLDTVLANTYSSSGYGKLILATQSTARLTVDETGRVGIGTTSPGAKLQINNASDSRLIVYETGTSPYTATLELSSYVYGTYGSTIQYNASPETLTIQNYGRSSAGSTQGGILFRTKLNNTTATDVMAINGFSGNVGIGTTAPKAKVNIANPSGTIGALSDSNLFILFNNATAQASSGFNHGKIGWTGYNRTVLSAYIESGIDSGTFDDHGYIAFGNSNASATATVERMRIAQDGNVGIGTASPTLSSGKGLHINSDSGHANLKLQSSGRTWELLSATGAYFSIFDTTGGSDRLSISSAGNVGVGTTSPADKLEVNGTTRTKKLRSNGIYYVGITGAKTSNASAFDMFDINNTNGNQTIEIVLSHHHSGGGQHGSFRRVILALNGYVAVIVLEDTSTNFGGGLGFTITRTSTSTIRIGWAGATAFATSYSFIGWIKGNGDYSVTNVGMDSLDAA